MTIMPTTTPNEVYTEAIFSNIRSSPELECIIMKHSWYSYYYALKVIKGRWIEAEDVIMTESYVSYLYAKWVIKGRLPEKMHNMMILHAIRYPDDSSVKDYLNFTK